MALWLFEPVEQDPGVTPFPFLIWLGFGLMLEQPECRPN
jgi:hypothetical protein